MDVQRIPAGGRRNSGGWAPGAPERPLRRPQSRQGLRKAVLPQKRGFLAHFLGFLAVFRSFWSHWRPWRAAAHPGEPSAQRWAPRGVHRRAAAVVICKAVGSVGRPTTDPRPLPKRTRTWSWRRADDDAGCGRRQTNGLNSIWSSINGFPDSFFHAVEGVFPDRGKPAGSPAGRFSALSRNAGFGDRKSSKSGRENPRRSFGREPRQRLERSRNQKMETVGGPAEDISRS